MDAWKNSRAHAVYTKTLLGFRECVSRVVGEYDPCTDFKWFSVKGCANGSRLIFINQVTGDLGRIHLTPTGWMVVETQGGGQ